MNFNEQVISPFKPIITVDNSFENGIDQNSFIFLYLSHLTQDFTDSQMVMLT